MAEPVPASLAPSGSASPRPDDPDPRMEADSTSQAEIDERGQLGARLLAMACVACLLLLAVGTWSNALPAHHYVALPALAVLLGVLGVVLRRMPQHFDTVVVVALTGFVGHLLVNALAGLPGVDTLRQMNHLTVIATWTPAAYIGMFMLARPRVAMILAACSFVALTTMLLVPLDFSDPVYRGRLLFTAISAVAVQLLTIFLVLGLGVARRRHRAARRELERLSRVADTDPLTGLANRRAIVPAIERAVLRLDASRASPASTVTLVDIDHFKQINDTFGHPAGDEVLRQFADVLAGHARPTDSIGRWGGEEFVIVSLDCDTTGARAHARLLQERIRAHDWPADLQVRASFGITRLMAGETLDSALKRADAALYLAKARGRDRVESIEAEPHDE